MDKIIPLQEFATNKQLTDDEVIALIVNETGVSEVDARFMLAIERGEVEGDVIEE